MGRRRAEARSQGSPEAQVVQSSPQHEDECLMAAEGVAEVSGWGQGQGCGQAFADQTQVDAQGWGRRSEEKGGLRSQQRGEQRQRQGRESDVELQQSEQL